MMINNLECEACGAINYLGALLCGVCGNLLSGQTEPQTAHEMMPSFDNPLNEQQRDDDLQPRCSNPESESIFSDERNENEPHLNGNIYDEKNARQEADKPYVSCLSGKPLYQDELYSLRRYVRQSREKACRQERSQR